VRGDGFTDHCPRCLWSVHVDENPGDRRSDCGGAMEPVGVRLQRAAAPDVLYRCSRCGHARWNRSAKDDDWNELVRLSTRPVAD
jgi:RNHCP domain